MDFKGTSPKQVTKVITLMTFATNIGMDLGGICGIARGAGSKETFMWHDDYKFELLVSDSSNDIVAFYYDRDNGVDQTIVCTEGTTLEELIELSEK